MGPRAKAIAMAKALWADVELSEDGQWYIAGPFQLAETPGEFAKHCESLGLETDGCLYDRSLVKFR